MAKFSVFRDGEDDDDDELGATSTPEPDPKRRRNSSAGDSFSVSQSPKEISKIPPDPIRDSAEEGAVERGNADEDPGGPVSVILSDPDVLDCSICFEPLTIPVYQCVNGHIACSSCCTNLRNRCPSCSEIIGQSRCRAIENVIESVKIICTYKSYGCQAKVSYCSKVSHEEACLYAPYACPFQDCPFRGSPKRLSVHLNQLHMNTVINFRFNSVFPCCFRMADKLFILHEEEEGTLFILNTRNNSLSIRCLGSTLSGQKRFGYALSVRRRGSSLRFQSFTDKATVGLHDSLSVDFLQVPGYFFNSNGSVRLEISIWREDTSFADISRPSRDVHESQAGNSS